jgi:hypothetical protein
VKYPIKRMKRKSYKAEEIFRTTHPTKN